MTQHPINVPRGGLQKLDIRAIFRHLIDSGIFSTDSKLQLTLLF